MADEKTTNKATSPLKGKPRAVRPVYCVFRVKDNSGAVLPLTKENLEIVGTYKDSDALLDIMDSGLAEGCFYKRIALD